MARRSARLAQHIDDYETQGTSFTMFVARARLYFWARIRSMHNTVAQTSRVCHTLQLARVIRMTSGRAEWDEKTGKPSTISFPQIFLQAS
jgi:hypothetical protein